MRVATRMTGTVLFLFLAACVTKPPSSEQTAYLQAINCAKNTKQHQAVHSFFGSLDTHDRNRINTVVERGEDLIFVKRIPEWSNPTEYLERINNRGLVRYNRLTEKVSLISNLPSNYDGHIAGYGNILWYQGRGHLRQPSGKNGLIFKDGSFLLQLKYNPQTDEYEPFEDKRIQSIRNLILNEDNNQPRLGMAIFTASENGYLFLATAPKNEILIVNNDGKMTRFPYFNKRSVLPVKIDSTNPVITAFFGSEDGQQYQPVEVDFGNAFEKNDVHLLKRKPVKADVFCEEGR